MLIKSFKDIEKLPEQEREALFDEAMRKMEAAEKESKKKRDQMERLIRSLLVIDSKSLGDAVKCYIVNEIDPHGRSDTVRKALSTIAEIKILELEC